ncbi:MAG: hypothetical protein PUF98_06050 [Oscillibacter sp.]|nr:hypothetical protein [Oscillibacter sp.]
MQENDEKRIERTVVWLDAKVVPRMDGWLEADNCQSRSEFVDKALRFYIGYLGTEDNTTYLSQAILTAIQGTLDLNNHRLQTILFKCAVELNMLCHTIAAHFRADPIHTRELRAYAVDEVKHTNGRVSFESAVRQQRRIEYEQDEEDDFE